MAAIDETIYEQLRPPGPSSPRHQPDEVAGDSLAAGAAIADQLARSRQLYRAGGGRRNRSGFARSCVLSGALVARSISCAMSGPRCCMHDGYREARNLLTI